MTAEETFMKIEALIRKKRINIQLRIMALSEPDLEQHWNISRLETTDALYQIEAILAEFEPSATSSAT